MNFDFNDLIILGTTIVIGYYIGLSTRRVKLPSLIGYMLLGVVLGTSGLNIFSESVLDHLSFISEITLAFVAFLIGSELSLSSLKRLGFGIVTIILAESFFAFFFVTMALYVLTGDLPMSLLFGALAPASAPAGTVYVIQEYKAKGTLTKALYAVVGFDDGLAIIIFGFALAMAKNLLVYESVGTGGGILPSLLKPFSEIILSLILGGFIGFIFSYLVRLLSQERDSLILVIGFVLFSTGLSITLHLSLILTNMVMGFVFVNIRRETLVKSVLKQIQITIPFMYILFFCLAGAHMKLSALPGLGMVGVLYIISRSAGLILGAGVGGIIGKVEKKIKKYIGMGILSQAGVAIGLSLIVRHELKEIGTSHADAISASVLTTITATCIFFEIIGPILTKIALEKAGEIPHSDK
ncbi:MAG TPA: hypothetical protein ENH82_04240 [bacterium]|nr:hypothetical protein [bacterium]